MSGDGSQVCSAAFMAERLEALSVSDRLVHGTRGMPTALRSSPGAGPRQRCCPRVWQSQRPEHRWERAGTLRWTLPGRESRGSSAPLASSSSDRRRTLARPPSRPGGSWLKLLSWETQGRPCPEGGDGHAGRGPAQGDGPGHAAHTGHSLRGGRTSAPPFPAKPLLETYSTEKGEMTEGCSLAPLTATPRIHHRREGFQRRQEMSPGPR